jgi:hypothetical protein
MDEFQHFERLDAEGDFEGGQWIGGEFVYSKRKKKAQQTEDDRLYGVFQGSSDEDELSGLRGWKRRRQTDDRELLKEVDFVSSGVVTETTERDCDIHEDGKTESTAEDAGTSKLLLMQPTNRLICPHKHGVCAQTHLAGHRTLLLIILLIHLQKPTSFSQPEELSTKHSEHTCLTQQIEHLSNPSAALLSACTILRAISVDPSPPR